MKEILHGHDSKENAFVVNNYPYGFRLRCKIRYWVETKKGHGQRFCSQTTNPKKTFEHWNKPKKGTYCVIIGMYKDEQDHITYETLSSGGWSKEEQIKQFEETYAPLTEYQIKAIKYIRATNEANKIIKCTITPATSEKPQQTREEQKEVWRKALNYGYAKIEGKIN